MFLLILCKSFPPETTRPAGSGSRDAAFAYFLVTHLDRTSAVTRLPVVFGGSSRYVALDGSRLLARSRGVRVSGIRCHVARPRRVDVETGAHRRRQRDALDVPPLRGGGLRTGDLLDHRGVVLEQLTLAEALLSDREVDVRPAVGAVLELAGLRVGDRLLRCRTSPCRSSGSASGRAGRAPGRAYRRCPSDRGWRSRRRSRGTHPRSSRRGRRSRRRPRRPLRPRAPCRPRRTRRPASSGPCRAGA